MTSGDTEEEAIANSDDAKRCWIEAAIEDGVTIWEPSVIALNV